MIIIGHRFISSENFFHIQNIDAINNTPPNSFIYLEFREDNLEIIKHLEKNNITFGLGVNDVTQIMYASNLGASYIFVQRDLAHTAQNLANEYLFDSKILVTIEEENEIEEFALQSIDGVIFSNAIIKTNS